MKIHSLDINIKASRLFLYPDNNRNRLLQHGWTKRTPAICLLVAQCSDLLTPLRSWWPLTIWKESAPSRNLYRFSASLATRWWSLPTSQETDRTWVASEDTLLFCLDGQKHQLTSNISIKCIVYTVYIYIYSVLINTHYFVSLFQQHWTPFVCVNVILKQAVIS